MNGMILRWMLKYSIERLNKVGYVMYIYRDEKWEKVFSYSFSQAGPPQPFITAMPVVADPAPAKVCKYGDPTCPCADGDSFHYEGENPWPKPGISSRLEKEKNG